MQERSQYHQRGSVLIVTLVVLSLISVMVSNLVYETRLELQIQQRVNSLTALRGMARGAVHQFASFMGTHVEETSNGPALEWWVDDTALRPIDSETGTTIIISGKEHLVTNGEQVAPIDDNDDPNLEENTTGNGLADAESRLNINVATPEQFMAFPGFSNILAEEIVRHREMLLGESDQGEEDGQAETQNGTSSSADVETVERYVNLPFRSLRDLLTVMGMTEEILYGHVAELDGAPADFLTCCSNGKINLNSAPHPTLVAAGFSEEEANVLVSERRGGRHFKDLSISGTVLPEFEEERWQKLSQAITVHSSTFPVTVHSTSSVSDQDLKIFARVFLGEKGVSFVSWREI